MERKPEDIKLYAKLGFLIFADGYTAQIAGMKPSKDNDNKDVWEFILAPSDELIKRYNLKPVQGQMIYRVQLSYELVIQLNADPAWTRYFYLGTWDGSTHPAVELLKGTIQQKEIEELKKQNRRLRMEKDVAVEEKQRMEINLPAHLKRNFAPILDQLSPVIEKIVKEKKND